LVLLPAVIEIIHYATHFTFPKLDESSYKLLVFVVVEIGEHSSSLSNLVNSAITGGDPQNPISQRHRFHSIR